MMSWSTPMLRRPPTAIDGHANGDRLAGRTPRLAAALPCRTAPSRTAARRAARDGAQHVAVAGSGVRAARCATMRTFMRWTQRGDYMLRLMRAMICAWRAEPALNAWYDAASNSRILLGHIDLAIAVDTPGGLIVPVVRNIESKTPDELRAAIAAQKEAAHQRSTDACGPARFHADAVEFRHSGRPLRHSAGGAARGRHPGRGQGARGCRWSSPARCARIGACRFP